MVEPLLYLLGAVVLLVTFTDLFWTVVTVGAGGGPLSRRTSALVWSLALRLHARRPSHRRLRAIGVGVLVATPLAWALLLWCGWSLLFLPGAETVVDRTGSPVTGWDRVYFAGYTVFTLGYGDLVPGTTPAQVASGIATLMGFSLVPLGITYLVPVVQAATTQRALARELYTVAPTPDDVVRTVLDDGSSGALATQIPSLIGKLSSLGEQHLTYPVLLFAHSTEPEAALWPRLAALSDGLALALTKLPGDDELAGALHALDRSLQMAVRTVAGPLDLDVEPPPLPSDELPDPVQEALAGRSDERALLRLLVARDGWRWDEAVNLTGRR